MARYFLHKVHNISILFIYVFYFIYLFIFIFFFFFFLGGEGGGYFTLRLGHFTIYSDLEYSSHI